MPIHDAIIEAQKLIGRFWKEEQSPERERILECAGYTLSFISATGQDYRFEDFRQSQAPDSPTPVDPRHLAVNHANVRCRALYPLSMADGYTVNDEVEPEPSRQD